MLPSSEGREQSRTVDQSRRGDRERDRRALNRQSKGERERRRAFVDLFDRKWGSRASFFFLHSSASKQREKRNSERILLVSSLLVFSLSARSELSRKAGTFPQRVVRAKERVGTTEVPEKKAEETNKNYMAGEGGREEAYVLRFVDAALAARVRATLAEEPDADPADVHMELDFDGTFFFLSV